MLEALNVTADEEAVYLALLDRARVPADDLAARDASAMSTRLWRAWRHVAWSRRARTPKGAYRVSGPQATV
jgi:hypothetical protein